jgi:hypothetical protein
VGFETTIPAFSRVTTVHGLDRTVQIWRLSANMMNKQSRTADMVWSSGFVVERGVAVHDRTVSFLFRLSNISLSRTFFWTSYSGIVCDWLLAVDRS